MRSTEAEIEQFPFKFPPSLLPKQAKILQAMHDAELSELPCDILAAMAASETFLNLAAVRPAIQTEWPAQTYRCARALICFSWSSWATVVADPVDLDLSRPGTAERLADFCAASRDIREVLRELEGMVVAAWGEFERARWPEHERVQQ